MLPFIVLAKAERAEQIRQVTYLRERASANTVAGFGALTSSMQQLSDSEDEDVVLAQNARKVQQDVSNSQRAHGPPYKPENILDIVTRLQNAQIPCFLAGTQALKYFGAKLVQTVRPPKRTTNSLLSFSTSSASLRCPTIPMIVPSSSCPHSPI